MIGFVVGDLLLFNKEQGAFFGVRPVKYVGDLRMP